MCGRYVIEVDEVEIREIINETVKNLGEDDNIKTGEIFPTNKAPVLLFENNKPKPIIMEWGFPNFRNKGVIINARAETVLEKRTYRDALLNRRCIIPSTGFYEWSHNNVNKKQKDKYLFNLPQTPMLYMAGLYNDYEKDGIKSKKFVILTTAANDSMKEIHDRMPVVLNEDNLKFWIENIDYAMCFLHLSSPSLIKSIV